MKRTFSSLETQIFKADSLSLLKASSGNEDLGFGTLVAQKARRRLVNRDGSFNVHRAGYSPIRARGMYHYLLNSSWPRFFAIIFCLYLAINSFFAVTYFICGTGAIQGANEETSILRLLDSFFFSIQTFATIGYGKLTPSGLVPNVLVTFEALIGLLGFALATGLFFARFSRPTARIIFSKLAVLAPYHGQNAFMFRIVNERKNQILDLEARVVMSRLELEGKTIRRKFYDLQLERKQVMFFPLHWTIVHPIDEESPLYGMTSAELEQSDVEFLIMLSGMDDTFSQIVHSWSSYKYEEIVWGARFSNILEENADGSIRIDLNRIHSVERVELSDPDSPLRSASA